MIHVFEIWRLKYYIFHLQCFPILWFYEYFLKEPIILYLEENRKKKKALFVKKMILNNPRDDFSVALLNSASDESSTN